LSIANINNISFVNNQISFYFAEKNEAFMKKIITTTFLFLSVLAQAQKKDKMVAVCPMGHGSSKSCGQAGA
jgi:hypothetical protein